MERRSEKMKERKNEGVAAQKHKETTARKNKGKRSDGVMNLKKAICGH